MPTEGWNGFMPGQLKGMRASDIKAVTVHKGFRDGMPPQLTALPVEAASSAQELMESVDILCLAATAIRPIIDGD